MTAREDSVTGNAALGGFGSGFRGTPIYGVGKGGGLYIDTAAMGYLDDFTVANVLNNTASTSDPNIYGSYKRLH
jgi:hypothetical protein